MDHAGDVNWVSQGNATQSKIAYVNDAGHAIVKVDDTSFVPYNSKRDSVCYAFDFGSAPDSVSRRSGSPPKTISPWARLSYSTRRTCPLAAL